MADLTDIQSAQTVKIAGANPSTGVEDNFMEVDSSGKITSKLNDGSGNSITIGQKTMSDSVPVVIASDQSIIPISVSSVGFLTSSSNSTTTPLGSNAVFTGSYEDISIYSEINITIFSDVSSASNGLEIDFSTDGVNADSVSSYTFDSTHGTGDSLTLPTIAKYIRIKYTNSSSAQSVFRLQTQYKTITAAPVTARANTSIFDNTLVGLTRSIITGHTSAGGGGYVNVKVSPSGALTIAIGDITGIVGQQTMAASIPVTIASDQSHFPIELQDGSGNNITSASNGNAGNRLLHTQTPDTTTASTALGVLNSTISIAMAGLSSVGFQLSAGTLIGTIVPECSIDGGTTWIACTFYDPSNSAVSSSVIFASSNTLKVLSILPIGGASNVRVRVSAYTSGTANALMRASMVSGAAGAVTSAAYGTITNTFVATGANTATKVLSSNVNRKYAYISNGSGTQVNIQFGSGTGLSNTTGIPIPAKNFYELKGDNLFTGDIYAFAASNVTLSIGEGTP